RQKRLAAAVLGCGKKKISLDPNENFTNASTNSRKLVRKLHKDNLTIRKPMIIHSHFRARRQLIAHRLGRHTGIGKRKGTSDARMPQKVLWMRRMHVLRCLLKRYRASHKIEKHLHHFLYQQCKGSIFKNKRVLIDHIHKKKAERVRAKHLNDQAEAMRHNHSKPVENPAEDAPTAAPAAKKQETKMAEVLKVEKKAPAARKPAASDSEKAPIVGSARLLPGLLVDYVITAPEQKKAVLPKPAVSAAPETKK
ncbi:60S ribosomal protein L19, partial [Hymenolepis weldensis]